MYHFKKRSGLVLCCCLLLIPGAVPAGSAHQTESSEPQVQDAIQTPQQLQQLVAPIALYPDALVAQILAAASYPGQVVEANRWMQQHTNLTGESLAQAVDQQPWDPSVRALTQFPTVLDNMDRNLSWTSALGDAYINQPQDVLDAVQSMRQRAYEAGNLQTTPQETVTAEGQTIIIQPANPEIVYVPAYNPWAIYGAPIPVYPDWDPVIGLYVPGPTILFGAGFGIRFFSGFGWGWHHWNADWRHHRVLFNRNTYISRTHTFVRRNYFYRGNPRFPNAPRPPGNIRANRPGNIRGNPPAYRPPAVPRYTAPPAPRYTAPPMPRYTAPPMPRGAAGSRPSALSGFNQGGIVRGYAQRGQTSLGGGFYPPTPRIGGAPGMGNMGGGRR